MKLVTLTMLVYSATVFAEVSDKAPSADFFWKIGLAAAIICFVGARMKPWLGIICFLPLAIWFGGLFLELHSRDHDDHVHIDLR